MHGWVEYITVLQTIRVHSDDPLHIVGHSLQEEGVEDVVVEGGVVLASALAVGREGDFE